MSRSRKQPPSPSELADELDLDVLEASCEAVDAELTACGIDPDAAAAWGRALVRERLEDRRLAWRIEAQRRLQEALSKGPRSDRPPLPQGREALLAMVESLRGKMGAAAEIAFRKREPATADEDELKMLIEELMLLDELDDSSDPDAGS